MPPQSPPHYIKEAGREGRMGISLAVQWLRLCASTAGVGGGFLFLVEELRSHMPQGAAKKKKRQDDFSA